MSGHIAAAPDFGMHPDAALLVERLEALSNLEADSLTPLPGSEVGDMSLGDPDGSSDLMLGKPFRNEVGDDFFPHAPNNSICCRELQQHALVQQLLLPAYARGMELEEIRRVRLRQWIDTDPVSMGDVEAWCTHYSKFVEAPGRTLNPTYIRQLVPRRGKPTRNIGERTARRLERIGSRPRGWLDDEAGAAQGKPAPTAGGLAYHQPKDTANGLPTGDAGATTGATTYAVAVQIETLRRSVRAIAEEFGLAPEDLVSDSPAARERVDAALGGTAAADSEIDRQKVGAPPADARLPPARGSTQEDSERVPGEIKPGEATDDEATSKPARKERRV